MSKYYVVSGDILPDVLEQVMQARILLQSGKAKRISEAVKMVGISRGTYYKYKDAVFSFNAEQSNRKAIISMILRNEKGTLSKVLSLVSVKQVNVLAINQTIPINGIANVALTLDISDLETIFFDTDREKATLIYSKMLQGIKNDYIEKAFSIYSMIYKNNDEMPSEEYSYYLNKCCINDIICDINKSRKIDRTYFNTYDYLLNNRKFQRK